MIHFAGGWLIEYSRMWKNHVGKHVSLPLFGPFGWVRRNEKVFTGSNFDISEVSE